MVAPTPGRVADLPTLAEFDLELGAPLLSFDLQQPRVEIPTGPPHCCRQVHQAHCGFHVAKTLIGCQFDILLPGGAVDERRPVRRTFEGDVMARPLEFAAAIQSVTVLAKATAEGEGGVLIRLVHHVWTLNLEQAAIWDYLVRQSEAEYQAALEHAEPHSTLWIEALPLEELDPSDVEAVARVMGKPDFRHVRAYARKVIVLPHEIGHDDTARYVTSILGGQPNDVPPLVEAILRDPHEDEG